MDRPEILSELHEQAAAWARIPSVDETHERLAALMEDNGWQALTLGTAEDGSPIFALGATSSEVPSRPRLLILGGVTGDGVLSVAAAGLILEHADRLLADWEVWAICALDMARLRLNDGALSQIKPSASEHVRVRRMPWGPGEDPERNLPLDADLIYQPDHAPAEQMPEDWVACSPAGLSLGRAISHLRPALTVSLRELPAGGLSFASSQELADLDSAALHQALAQAGTAIYSAGKQRDGRQIHGQPGLVVLPSLDEERARLRAGDEQADQRRYTGGVSAWQVLNAQNPEALYLAVDVPRLSHRGFGSDAESDEQRSVHVSRESRERKTEQTFRVVRLHRPGHPADGAELRVEATKEEGIAEGLHENLAAASGWLAVEAHVRRRHVLRVALEAFEAALPHLAHDEHIRAMQLLREASDGHDKLIGSFQTNKRYGRRASEAEALYWTAAFPYTTALILAEARRGLERENREDREVKTALDAVDALLATELESSRVLRAVAPDRALSAMAGFVVAAADAAAGGGPAVTRAQARVTAAEKVAAERRKRVRELRQLKRPRADRAEAEQQLAAAEQILAARKEALETLAPVEPDTAADTIEDPPTSEVEERTPIAEQTPPPTDSSPASELPADADSPADTEESPSPDVVPADDFPAEPDAAPGPADDSSATSAEEAPAPAEDPIAPASDTQSAVPVSEDQQDTSAAGGQDSPDLERHSPEEPADDEGSADDFEQHLPEHLRLPSEWGRGPLVWEQQIPDNQDAPPFRRMMQEIAEREPTVGPALSWDEPVEEVAGVEIERSDGSEALGDVTGAEVGFYRRRVDLTDRRSEAIPSLAVPHATGGSFEKRARRLG